MEKKDFNINLIREIIETRFNNLINFINFYENIINKIFYLIERNGRLIDEYKKYD